MSLSPEEMFYLATGLLDLESWATSRSGKGKYEAGCMANNDYSRTKRAVYPLSRPDHTETVLNAPMLPSRASQSSKTTPSSILSPKKCDSSYSSSLLPKSSRCSESSYASRTVTPPMPPSSAWLYRLSWRTIYLATLVIFLAFSFQPAEGCSSRSTPKPRPPPPLPSPTPAVRPNITFQTYACPPAYATYYCLNGATCFTIKIGESILYNCECTEGFMGQRCEYKDLDGSYLPLREKIMLERASIAGGATFAVVLVVIISIIFYTYVRQQRKERGEERISFEQVTVDKIQMRNRSLSSFSNHDEWRFGVSSGKNDFLDRQHRFLFCLPTDTKTINLQGPVCADAQWARLHRLPGPSPIPVTPFAMLNGEPSVNAVKVLELLHDAHNVVCAPNNRSGKMTTIVTTT